MLKIAKKRLKMSFLGLWRRLERPRNSNHSNISRVGNTFFFAFGYDFRWKKCLGHRRIRGFDFCENAETLYSTYQNDFFFEFIGQMRGTARFSTKNMCSRSKIVFSRRQNSSSGHPNFAGNRENQVKSCSRSSFWGGPKEPKRAINGLK